MSKEKASGYIKEGEVLFVAPQNPHLAVVLHSGGPVQLDDGSYVNSKARFAAFRPGPMGGEYRTSNQKEIARLRELDGADHSFLEVTSETQIPALLDRREKIVADRGPDVSRGVRTSAPSRTEAPEAPAPVERSRAAAPAAARVPSRDEF